MAVGQLVVLLLLLLLPLRGPKARKTASSIEAILRPATNCCSISSNSSSFGFLFMKYAESVKRHSLVIKAQGVLMILARIYRGNICHWHILINS